MGVLGDWLKETKAAERKELLGLVKKNPVVDLATYKKIKQNGALNVVRMSDVAPEKRGDA